METTEALKILVSMQHAYQRMDLTEYAEALRIATHAIDDELFHKELRTGKEPIPCIINTDEGMETVNYCCPNCKKSGIKLVYKYCPNCGQALSLEGD